MHIFANPVTFYEQGGTKTEFNLKSCTMHNAIAGLLV